MFARHQHAQGRPYLRSAIARSLYEKMANEQYVKNFDKSQWYKCNVDKMDPHLCESFVQLSVDAETEEFINSCCKKSDWLFTHLWHSFAKIFLCYFMTQTSMNGLLGRGSMFVLSSSQFTKLLGVDSDWKTESLLDLGAGDGKVTDQMAPYFEKVYTTEVSPVMKKILRDKGFTVFEPNGWNSDTSPQTYDVIACLNLLDRCDKPLTLLDDIKSKMSPSGILIVALVLPVSQFVESNKNHSANEELEIAGKTFDDQVASAYNVFDKSGYEVIKWSRVPYLCEGDMQQPYYWLNDAVFILQRKRLL